MLLGGWLHAQPLRTTATPFVQLHAGALNPSGPFRTTLSYGVGVGLDIGPAALAVHITRQSRDRNSGSDLNRDARTFVTGVVEAALVNLRGLPPRQIFVRLDAGFLLRAPLRTAPVTGVGLGWRFHLFPHVTLVGVLFDDLAWLPAETFRCPAPGIFGGTTTCVVESGAQHNFGGIVAVRLHP